MVDSSAGAAGLPPQHRPASAYNHAVLTFAPLIFVVIWSTGFIAARAAAPYADPNLFLIIRFALTALCFAVLARRIAWPTGRQALLHAVAGMLMNGLYLSGAWWSIAHGVAAGVMALLGALQPLLTALVAVIWLRARLSLRTWIGLGIGIVGVALVIVPKLAATGLGELAPWPVAVAVGSIFALTAGTMIQKSSISGGDLRSAGAIQNGAAALVAVVLFSAVGTWHWENHPAVWASLAWSVGVLSLGGATLLIWMVRHGEATRTTSLMLLVPPLAAIEAYFLFGETLNTLQIAGFALAIGGVVLARRA